MTTERNIPRNRTHLVEVTQAWGPIVRRILERNGCEVVHHEQGAVEHHIVVESQLTDETIREHIWAEGSRSMWARVIQIKDH